MGILNSIFGGEKKSSKKVNGLIEETLDGIIERMGIDISYDLEISQGENESRPTIHVELFGADEKMLIQKDGQLLDALQLLLKRILQHNIESEVYNVTFDSNGFRTNMNEDLVRMAEKLKETVINKGKSVYFRALPPKDRRIVHQYISEDGRVKSRSVGEGLYKKIKIFPVNEESRSRP